MLGSEHPVMECNNQAELSSLVNVVFVIVFRQHLYIELRKNMKNLNQDLYVDITGAIFFW
jgi:hypothetical protein